VIIGPDSPLRRLPAALDLRRRLYFDGIRYSIEMADVAYSRLKDILHNLSVNYASLGGTHHRYFASALLDAWSAIDSVERLRGLLRQTPGIKQRSPGLVVFDQKTADVKVLRDSVQHLNHGIDALLRDGLPVWGALSWAFAAEEPVRRVQCFTLVAGSTMFDCKPAQIVNPAGRSMEIPVGLVTLAASGATVCISEVMEQVEQLATRLEGVLAEQFQNLPPASGDMLAVVQIEFDEESMDIPQDEENAGIPV
jgi:hypothetical protein